MRKICSLVLCFMMLFMCIPAGLAEDVPADPAASSNADLSSLQVAGEYDLAPDFDSGTTSYAVSIPNEAESIDITATTADENASLTIDGTVAFSGAAQTVSGLQVGDTDIVIGVTAQDGTTVKNYTLTINRADVLLNDNADLESLGVTGYNLDQVFAAGTTEYTLTVPFETDSVEITATAADTNAGVNITGPVSSLVVGENDIAVVVTAEDEVTTKTYTITITREECPSDNADLESLRVTGYPLDQDFDPAITAYAITISSEAESLDITASTVDTNAALTIGGAAAFSGTAQTVSGLTVGENPIDVVVTSRDETIEKTYTITVTRPISDNADLDSLSVETYDGTTTTVCGIYPTFSSDETEGIVDVPNSVNEVRITAQPYSSTATLEVNGTPVIGGETAVINGAELNVGDNPIEIEVTAASGSQRCYTLHVKKVSADYVLPELPSTPAAYQESDYACYSRRVAAGRDHILVVKSDGTVAAWGDNGAGQCNMPPEVNDVIAVSAGNYHSLALKADGTVVAWGMNDLGQCTVPEVLNDKVIVDICAVSKTSLALDTDGKVWAWGGGSDDYYLSSIPSDLSQSTVVDIQGGSRQLLALLSSGEVRIWGSSTWFDYAIPDEAKQDVVAIAAGERNNVALKNDGTVVVWGAASSKYAIEALNLQYIKGIAAGYRYVAALKWDGSVAVWGGGGTYACSISIPLELENKPLAVIGSGVDKYMLAFNEDGTLGIWENTSNLEPYMPSSLNLLEDEVPYSGPSPDIPQTPAEYAASSYVQGPAKIGSTEYGLAILNMDGTVKLIQTSDRDDFNLAQIPEGLNSVTAITTSSSNIMALKRNGTVVVWGLDDDGQCQVPDSAQDIVAITLTQNTNDCCLALKNDGTLVAWGNDSYGQCQVPDGLDNVTAIAAGNDHFLALKEDGTVVAWGNNDYGQCDVPGGLDNVARVFAEHYYSMALKHDGTVVAWGSNQDVQNQYYCGQCDVPEGLSGVVDVCIRSERCLALKNNGTVVAWGENYSGCRNVPVGLHDVAAVSLGSEGGSKAIKIDGSVVCWGNLDNFDDEILTGLSNVLTISNGIIIFRDGTLQYYDVSPADNDDINAMLEGLNVLSGHYFVIDEVDLLNSAGSEISTVPSQGGYRIQAGIDNNYGSATGGLTIIQVRGGANASSESGGQVLGCVGVFSTDIPVSGTTVSSDFTLPSGISGEAYVDVFVWEDWASMVPRAAANQELSFTVSEE